MTIQARGAALVVLVVLVVLAAAAVVDARGDDTPLRAPNVVVISPRLVTSGQPTADALASLKTRGFEAVIDLAPLTVDDAVPGEPEIVRAQGLEFVHIPIPFGKPTQADVQAFTAAMNRLRERKVLVHCEVNFRASTMTFLYRVMSGGESPERAYESVAKVWSPEGTWKRLVTSQLQMAHIDFQPY